MLLLCSAWRNAVTCLLLAAVLTDAVFEDEDAEDTKSGPGVLEIKTMAAVDAMLDRVFFLLRFGMTGMVTATEKAMIIIII